MAKQTLREKFRELFGSDSDLESDDSTSADASAPAVAPEPVVARAPPSREAQRMLLRAALQRRRRRRRGPRIRSIETPPGPVRIAIPVTTVSIADPTTSDQPSEPPVPRERPPTPEPQLEIEFAPGRVARVPLQAITTHRRFTIFEPDGKWRLRFGANRRLQSAYRQHDKQNQVTEYCPHTVFLERGVM